MQNSIELSEKSSISADAACKKKKRHFFLSVLGIAMVLILAGELLAFLIDIIAHKLFPNMSGGTAFLLMYLEAGGTAIAVAAYCILAEKGIFKSFFASGRGGMSGNTIKNFGLGLLIGLVMNGACILFAYLHGDLHFYMGDIHFPYLICALIVVCIQSGAEELLTRGYMMGALRERYNIWIAIAINSLFFGFLHLFNPGITVLSMLNIVLIGFALSLVAYYLDSLWMCIAIHTAWNYTQSILFGLPNSGIVSDGSLLHLEASTNSLFYDASFGIEGSLSAVVVICLLAIAVFCTQTKKAGIFLKK